MPITTTVRGTITATSSGNPISDLTIQIWEDRNRTVLKTVQTGSDGKYTAILDIIPPEARLYVNIYKHDFELLDNSSSKFSYVAGETYIKNYNVEIPMDVTGTLLTHDGNIDSATAETNVENKTIKLFAKTFGSEQLLNETKTDEKGIFNLHYYKDPATTRLDLLVKVYYSGKEKPDFISDLQIDVKENLKIDFLVTGDKYIGVSKVTDTFNKIDLLVENSGVALKDLTDNDVKLLTLDNEIDEDTANKYIRAKQLMTDMNVTSPNITDEVLFGLMKKGISVEPAQMLVQDKIILYNTIIDAVDSNVINSGEIIDEENPSNNISKEQWAENVAADLKKLAVSLAENIDSEVEGKFTLYDTLKDIDSTKRRSFLEHYVLNEEQDEIFWRNIVENTDITETETNKLKYNFDLAKISDFSKEIYDELYDYSVTNAIDSIENLSKSNTNWTVFASGITDINKFPDYIEGETLAEKQAFLAKLLKNKIETKFPSNVLSVHILNSGTEYSAVKTYLQSNPNFVFGETKADDTEDDLKAIQRLFNILPLTEKSEILDILWANNIKSAHDIVKLGQKEFNKLFISSDISTDLINETFANAQKKHSQVITTFAKYSNKTSATDTYVLKTRTNADDLESIFTSFDYCDCKDCRSTLSPAAYLTDNLAFLNSIDNGGGNLFNKLTERRPDIEQTLLNCKNTDTPVPYIDIINEVLEEAVSPYMATENYPQTDWESDEIDANPEHFNSSAYSKLADYTQGSISPLKLPYNYWNDEAKSFLSHFNLKLSSIIELFNETSDINESISYLGISAEDKQFITKNLSYNYSSNVITEILKDTQLTFDEFAELLRSKSANPNLTQLPDLSDCNLEGKTIDTSAQTGVNPVDIFIFKRFLNVLGWSLEELDKVFIQNGYTVDGIDDNLIIEITQIKKIQDLTKLPVEELLIFWGDIDVLTHIDSKNSFYYQKFLNNVYDDSYDIFKLSGSEIEGSPGISSNISIIASVVNLSEDEVSYLKDSDTLTIANLSKLNRYSILSKALGLSIYELEDVQQLTTVNPFIDPEKSLKFIDIVSIIDKSGFLVEDLEYLLSNGQSSVLYPNAEKIFSFLEKLQIDLNQLKNDYESEKFDKETILRDTLKLMGKEDNFIEDVIKVINKTYTGSDAQTFVEANNDVFLPSFIPYVDDGNASTPPVLVPELNSDENFIVFEQAADVEIEDTDTRLKTILDVPAIKENIYKLIFRENVTTAFINEFGIDLDFMTEILDVFVQIDISSVMTPAMDVLTNETFLTVEFAETDNYFKIYDIINKGSAFVLNYKINLFEYLASTDSYISGETLNIFDISYPDSTPETRFNRWKNTNSLFELQIKYFDTSDEIVFDFFSNDYSGLLAVTNWDTTDFNTLLTTIDSTGTITAETLLKISKIFDLSHEIGLSIATLKDWALSYNIYDIAKNIQSAVKAKYDIKTWKRVATPIMNNLREKRRDALSAFIINKGFAPDPVNAPDDKVFFNDTNELYEYFLLDTEMSSCMKTSRIVLANSVTQLFMQRVSLNLEENLELTDEQAKEWAWRKKYRLWEANRKVFLYPENWLEPELRDNKSPFFKEMEEELLQVDLNNENAETIYKNYLQKLNEVAKLEIAQHYYDKESDELHVFARTFGAPNIYYYRKRDEYKQWTAWEKIDLEISGKIIMPIVYNKTLYLFWVKYLPVKSDDGNRMADVHIMWSEYKNNKWTSGKMSEEAFRGAHLDVVNESKRYYFIEENEGSIYINAVISEDGENDYILENYEFKLKFNLSEKTFKKINTGIRTFINNVNKSDLNKYFNGKYYFIKNKQFSLLYEGDSILGDGNDYWEREVWDADMNRPILTNQPEVEYRITLPHQEKFYKSENPFFFEDVENVFLAVINEPYEKPEQNEEGDIIETEAKPIRCQSNAITNVLKSSIPVFDSEINFNKTDELNSDELK